MTYINSIIYSDSSNLDAFARVRTAIPFTIFESKQSVDKESLIWDESGGTITHSASDATTTISSTFGSAIRQTRMRFNCKSGKSYLVRMAGVITQSAAIKRIGFFNDSNGSDANKDGIYFESSYSDVTVNIAKNGLITSVSKSSWNLDKLDGNGPSGESASLLGTAYDFFIEFEWFGRVRFGVYIKGTPYYVHQMFNNNLTSNFSSSPNHSIRYEVRGSGSLIQMSSSIRCESMLDQNGLIINAAHDETSAGIEIAENNVLKPLIGIKLNSSYLSSTILPKKISVISSASASKYRWALLLNPSVSLSVPGSSFTYVNVSNTSVSVAKGNFKPTVSTNGTELCGGFFSTDTTVELNLDNVLGLGATIGGSPDAMVLCVSRISGSTTDNIRGGLTFRDLA